MPGNNCTRYFYYRPTLLLNVKNDVAAEVLTVVEDNRDIDMPDVTGEEVAKAVRRL